MVPYVAALKLQVFEYAFSLFRVCPWIQAVLPACLSERRSSHDILSFPPRSMQERCPPCVDDFLYICDDAYKREELISMEMSILQTLHFDINIPVAYRFLRRFAKVSQCSAVAWEIGRRLGSIAEYKRVCGGGRTCSERCLCTSARAAVP